MVSLFFVNRITGPKLENMLKVGEEQKLWQDVTNMTEPYRQWFEGLSVSN